MQSFRCDGSWSFASGIGLEIYDAHLGMNLIVLNIYGPYLNRVPFWNDLLSKSFISIRKVILGGDLNLSLGCVEVWGPRAVPDSLAPFFSNAFSCHDLLDIAPIKLSPTWRNKRTGENWVQIDWTYLCSGCRHTSVGL